MKLAIGWLLFGVPLGAAVIAGFGLYRNWSNEHHRLTKVLAIVMAISAALLGFGTTAYVQLVRPLPAFDYSVEETGLLLSLVGTILGVVTLHFPRWVFFAGFRRFDVDARVVFSAWFYVLKAQTASGDSLSPRFSPIGEISRFHLLTR